MSDELNEFEKLLKYHSKKGIKPQMVWAKVTEVDWNQKRMTAISLMDGLEYFDIQLGLGSIYKKPKVGAKCLLGVIGNKDAATFLIEVEAFEETIIKSDSTEFVIKEEGFIIKKGTENLKNVFNDFMDEVNKILVIQGNTINVPAVKAIKQRLNNILK